MELKLADYICGNLLKPMYGGELDACGVFRTGGKSSLGEDMAL